MADFTTFTEVDPSNHYTVTAPKVAFAGITENEEAYVYKDKGINHFDGDFSHLFDVEITSVSGNLAYIFYAVSEAVDDAYGVYLSNDHQLDFELSHFAGTPYLNLTEQFDASTQYFDQWGGGSDGTTYYITVERDEAIGTYGTLFAYIHSDAERTTLLDTLSIALHAKDDFRYLYGGQVWKDGGVQTATGFTQNLDLQEAVGGGEVVYFRRRRRS